MSSPHQTCPDKQELQLFLNGSLDAADCAPLDAHLESCEHCQSLIAALTERNSPAEKTEGLLPRKFAVAVTAKLAKPELVATNDEEESSIGSRRIGPYATTHKLGFGGMGTVYLCLLYTSPSPRDQRGSRMPSSA